MISIIVAVDKNNLIGANNSLPWNLPADLKHFKELTTGHLIIMGRKTHNSIGKILSGRINVVISNSSRENSKDLIFVKSFDEAICYISNNAPNDEEVFIIGGASVYNQAIERANKIYLTKIDSEFSGDVYFPKFDMTKWKKISEKKYQSDAINKYNYRFIELAKI